MEGVDKLVNYERRSNQRGGDEERTNWLRKRMTERLRVISEDKDSINLAEQYAVELAVADANLSMAGIRDSMTGAFSRKTMLEVVQAQVVDMEAADGKKSLVAMCDLDNFRKVAVPKGVNAEEKKAATERADMAIKEYFKLVRETAIDKSKQPGGERWKELVVGRMGGEEMLLVVGDVGDEQIARQMLEELRETVEQKLAQAARLDEVDKNLVQTMSVGAIVVEGDMNREQILDAADTNCFKAKAEGRNRVVLSVGRSGNGGEDMPKNEQWRERWNQVRDFEKRPELIEKLKQKYVNDMNEAMANGTITELVEKWVTKFDHLESEVVIDDLTGAINREAGLILTRKMVEQDVANGHKVGLAILDIDRFKEVNDIQGHGMGDKVLKGVVKVTEEMLEEMGMRNCLVIRWQPGGKFLVVVPHQKDSEKIEQVIVELGKNMGKRLVEKETPEITISVGVAITNGDSGVDSVIERADKLKDIAKGEGNEGRNRMVIGDKVVKFG